MNRSLHLSESFVINCGTVTIDIDQFKALVIYLRKTTFQRGEKMWGNSSKQQPFARRMKKQDTSLSYYPFS
ncbi:hypothetical protein BDR07DRAFT_1439777 [Suillus spraguei]|nr:hypothetical protein BDR07DRAFT_1439777 [Suillus spraguei]